MTATKSGEHREGQNPMRPIGRNYTMRRDLRSLGLPSSTPCSKNKTFEVSVFPK